MTKRTATGGFVSSLHTQQHQEQQAERQNLLSLHQESVVPQDQLINQVEIKARPRSRRRARAVYASSRLAGRTEMAEPSSPSICTV